MLLCGMYQLLFYCHPCRSPATLQDLEVQLNKAKEDLTTAGLKLRAMIRAFKENQLYVTPLPTGDSEQGK